MSSSADITPPPFDRDAFLARVLGDVHLASAMAELFVRECPRMLDAVREAVAGGDALEVWRTAHALKGSVANFAAPAATAAAEHVELLGRSGALTDAEDAVRTLADELARLVPALRELIA